MKRYVDTSGKCLKKQAYRYNGQLMPSFIILSFQIVGLWMLYMFVLWTFVRSIISAKSLR